MTNTNDFRQYSYSSDTSYLIESFSYNRGSHAPKLRPEEDPKLKLREGKSKLKSKTQLRKEQKLSFRKAAAVVSVAVICLLLIAFALHSFALKNELTRDIQKTQTSIANANSEHISLESQLDALVSISTIDKYAVEKLHMSKVKSNQIKYISVDEFKTERENVLTDKNKEISNKNDN
ncbi:MAG: hypothetical protein IJR70_05290 [Eubacterium sp.]|nr:hypothetical protein [Eubacterium sp.]